MHLLNERARAERIQTGETSAEQDVALTDDARASEGDLVITRRNARALRTGRDGWVRNGDRWKVTDVRSDGSIKVQRHGRRRGASVVLPSEYVGEHVELGYAVTAHRSQGMTVDTAHVVITGGTTRENLYVAMTRGREANMGYVALDRPDGLHVPPRADDIDAVVVLYGVLNHTGSELSAHQTIAAEQDQWSGIAQVAAEYETIATAATLERYEAIVRDGLRGAGLGAAVVADVIASDAFGSLAAEMRRAESGGADLPTLMSEAVGRRRLDDADDVAAVLHYRLGRAVADLALDPELIVGMTPAVAVDLADDVRAALDERRDLMEARARSLAVTAVRSGEAWVRSLGQEPSLPDQQVRWLRNVEIVASYRDRYGITSDAPLGVEPTTIARRRDAAHAAAAARNAVALADTLDDQLDDALASGLELG